MGEARPPLSDVETVREELRRLGYLHSGLDRFVLRDAGAGSPVRASVHAALRVGLVGGVVFGAAGTLAAAGFDPRLLGEPQDLVVLAVYLTLAFAALTGLTALAGGLIAAWARRVGHRPGPDLARNAGLAVALAAAAYVALWWRSHLSGASVPAQAAALVVGLALALGLGRFASLAAVSVLAAGGIGDRLPRAGLGWRRTLPFLAGAAVVFAAVVGGGAWLASEAPPEAPDYAVVPTGLRVKVLAIDGLERRMAGQLVERGAMPTLADLLASGAHAALLAEPERVPAIVWTTVATGRGPAAHGIRSADARQLAGLRTPVRIDTDRGPFVSALATATDLLRLTRKQPPSAALRSVKAFWNVASDKGLRVGVVNWWATWPAEPVNGYLVTDRALLKLERGGPFDREAHPEAVLEQLRPLVPPGDGERSRRLDSFHLAAARSLRATSPVDLEILYLPGLDIFTMQQLGDAPESDLAALDEKLAAIRDGYREVDRLIGEFAAGLAATDVLVLVADPGRLARAGNPSPQGLLVLKGAPIVPGALDPASERDIAPTLLHLLGLPRSRELEGRVLEAALSKEFRRAHPVRTVDSYGRRPPAPATGSSFDADVMEELKSLGYIQ